MKKPELLAPAGNLEKLKTAIDYGADAVYVGGEAYSLRVACENFTIPELYEGVAYAHDRGKKVYLTANIIPHNKDIEDFENYIDLIRPIGFDAILVSDLGMFDIVKNKAPNIDIHISTQANNVNYKSACMWHKLGAKRVVLAREMSLEEISQIKENIPKDLEIEAFVHGAMCISYSGRCLLSNYMTSRDSNRGACAHPCRWNYSLVEETRPGEYMNVYENERGTFIMNSKDLCMIRHIPELVESGIESFKIEGRVKTAYYLATVVKAYRNELDRYLQDKGNYVFDERSFEELLKVSHRPYTTGFYFNKPDENSQVYTDSSYIRNYDLVGIVTDFDETNKMLKMTLRNRVFKGEELEIMQPFTDFIKITPEELFDENDEKIEVANHAEMIVKFKTNEKIVSGAMVRKIRK